MFSLKSPNQTPVIPPIQSRPTTAVSTSSHPTQSLQDVLQKLGTLNERHENLKALVDALRVQALICI